MLTDSEKRWLRGKELAPRAYCVWCFKFNLGSKICKPGWCPTDYAPADDFDARVAAKLADPYFPSMYKGRTFECGLFIMPPMDRLRCARIAVEEEIDENS